MEHHLWARGGYTRTPLQARLGYGREDAMKSCTTECLVGHRSGRVVGNCSTTQRSKCTRAVAVRKKRREHYIPGMYSMICPKLELLEGPMAVDAVSGPLE